jgi:hypothetical protein
MQKYCTESCRVLACRHRKKDLFGMQGGQLKDRNKTTNSALAEDLKEIKSSIKEFKTENHRVLNEKSSSQDERLMQLYAKITDLQVDQKNALNLQKWQIFLSVAMPLISPKIVEIVKKVFSSEKPVETLEEFNTKLDPFLKDVPDDLRDSLIDSAKLYYNSFKRGGFNFD